MPYWRLVRSTQSKGVVFVLAVVLVASVGTRKADGEQCSDQSGFSGPPPVMLKYAPRKVLTVFKLNQAFERGTVSDIEIADFDGDGRNDLAVAWYANHVSDARKHKRKLYVYFNTGTGLAKAQSLNLYEYDPDIIAFSIFRSGTGPIASGDFDGDGDVDMAVGPFHSDEIWFIENTGGRSFQQHVRFPFGYNSVGNFQTPPEMVAGDLDGDGRDELIVLSDSSFYLDGSIVHIWTTSDEVADMYRASWAPWFSDLPPTTQTYGLAVDDFDADGRLDIAYSALFDAPDYRPGLTVWHNFDGMQFEIDNVYAESWASDVVAWAATPSCPPSLLLGDMDSERFWHWDAGCDDEVDFESLGSIDGLAGLGPNWGTSLAVADLDGDGDQDLITKQRHGMELDANQINVVLYRSEDAQWEVLSPPPVGTIGFATDPANAILRPHNLAVADLMGNRLPDVVGGFGVSSSAERDSAAIKVAIWQNSCTGDVNRDGWTNEDDLDLVTDHIGTCAGDPDFLVDADADRNGCVDGQDVSIVSTDLGCRVWDCPGDLLGDMTCDCRITLDDVNPFIVAMSSREEYEACFPDCRWLNGDVNGDGDVSFTDIDGFIALIEQQGGFMCGRDCGF